MGNTSVRPDVMTGLIKEDDRVCISTLNNDGQFNQQCTRVNDLGDGTCKRVDMGNGYYAETCYGRSNVQNNTVQTLATDNVWNTSNNNTWNSVPETTVWEVQSGNRTPVTLSESDISMLNTNNGRQNGNLRIQPLNNGGISIRFD